MVGDNLERFCDKVLVDFHCINSLPMIVPKVISLLNYDNRAFWHAVYKPGFFRVSKFST